MKIPTFVRKRLLAWARRKLADVDRVIPRGDKQPYLERKFLFRSRFLTVYLHRFVAPDVGVDPHDHPWPFLSVVLSGAYSELVYDHLNLRAAPRNVHRRAGDVIYRPAEWTHRIVDITAPGDTITLVICGPRRYHWGFWVLPKSGDTAPPVWIPHEEYLQSRGLRD